MFIKWKYKPSGNCPVQAEGWFMGYYFYFRSRWDTARIEFAKTDRDWYDDKHVAVYKLLHTTDRLEAGWLPKWKCRLLINIGCFLFIFRRKQKSNNNDTNATNARLGEVFNPITRQFHKTSRKRIKR